MNIIKLAIARPVTTAVMVILMSFINYATANRRVHYQ